MYRFLKKTLIIRHEKYVKGGNRFREKRINYFLRHFVSKDSEVILDLGFGYGLFEKQLMNKKRRNKVIAVDNITRGVKAYSNVIQFIVADACFLPFKENCINVVFCNSVIEHIGGYHKQIMMVREIDRVSKKFFIQTPNKHFPIEAHHLIPFFQYLPKNVQKKVARRFLSHYEEVWLLGKKALLGIAAEIKNKRVEIVSEKFFCLAKSFYIVKS